MNIKQKRLLGLSVVLISVLIVATVISVVPLQFVTNGNGGGGGGGDDPGPEPDPYIPMPIILIPTPPVLNTISPSLDLDGLVYLRWSVVTDATGYKLYMSKDGGSWLLIKTTAYITFSKTGLTNGVYRFKVKSYNSAGYSAYSNIRSVIVSIPPPPPPPPNPPVLNTISPNPDPDGSIYLSWNLIIEADSYQVWMSKDGGNWESVVTFFVDYVYNDLTDGTYRFKVRAYKDGLYSLYSNVESVVVLIVSPIPDAPILSAIIPNLDTDGEIRLEWNVVDKANHYTIYRAKDGGTFEPLIEVFTQIYYDDVIEIDGTYSYKVKAGNDDGYSGFSNEESVIVQLLVLMPPEPPTMNNLTYIIVDEDVIVQLSWSEVDCDGYNVYRSIDFGGYILIEGNVLSTGYSDTLTDVGVYFYRVSAIDVSGESELSNPTIIEILEEEEPIIVEPEEPPTEPVDYTMLYFLIIALGVLAIPTIILVKKKKDKS